MTIWDELYRSGRYALSGLAFLFLSNLGLQAGTTLSRSSGFAELPEFFTTVGVILLVIGAVSVGRGIFGLLGIIQPRSRPTLDDPDPQPEERGGWEGPPPVPPSPPPPGRDSHPAAAGQRTFGRR